MAAPAPATGRQGQAGTPRLDYPPAPWRDRPRIAPNIWNEHAHLLDGESAWVTCPTIELLDMTAPEDGAGWYARVARAEIRASEEASSDADRGEDDLRISWAPLPRRPARDKAR